MKNWRVKNPQFSYERSDESKATKFGHVHSDGSKFRYEMRGNVTQEQMHTGGLNMFGLSQLNLSFKTRR